MMIGMMVIAFPIMAIHMVDHGAVCSTTVLNSFVPKISFKANVDEKTGAPRWVGKGKN